MEDERKPTTEDTFFMYGSLRRGMYNHYILKDKSKFISNAKISRFKLLSFGSFPAVIPSDDENDFVVGELFKITDDEVITSIDRMELNYGYKRTFTKAIDEFGNEHDIIFYEYTKPQYCENAEVVESGDWVKFKEGDKHGR